MIYRGRFITVEKNMILNTSQKDVPYFAIPGDLWGSLVGYGEKSYCEISIVQYVK